jgi:general secretion pathway protein L
MRVGSDRIPEDEWRMRAFFDWWFHQLAGLLPMAMVGEPGDRPDAVIVEMDGDDLGILIRRNGQTIRKERVRADMGLGEVPAMIAKLENRPHFILVELPTTQLLQKRLSLPIAAQRDLGSVLDFEIERETPFAPDEVYWTYAVQQRDVSAGRLEVDLLLVPRGGVDPLLRVLADAGLNLAGIEVASQNATTAFISLEAGKKTGDWVHARRPLMPLAVAACVLALVAAALPFIFQQWAISSADAAIAALSETARDAAALHQSIDRVAGTAAFLDKERAQNGSALATLAALTSAIPDDAYLTAATFRDGKLTLAGMSPSAAQIISELAQSKEFHEPSFEAPVTQSQESDLETFTISVSVASAAAP